MNTLQRCKPLLGTFVEVTVQDDVSDKALIEQSNAVFKEIEHIESTMSFHNKYSELSFINRYAHRRPVSMSKDMSKVINQALVLSYLTKGVYDISVAPDLVSSGLLPDHDYDVDPHASWQDVVIISERIHFNRPLTLDLGGIAKGYAVDKAVAAADGNCQVIVNAGGDLKMSHWQNQHASIRVPDSTSGQTIDIPMQAAAVATSGHYFLDGDIAIVNANTKQKVDDDISVSVFSNSCMLADALTKVDFLYEGSASIISAFQAKTFRMDRSGKTLM